MKILNISFKEWRLESTTGEPVTLLFTEFNIEGVHSACGGSCCDWIEINDGSSTQRYCNEVYGTPGPNPGPVTGNTITVKFSSDGYEGGNKGFLATVCCSASITTNVTGE